MEMASYPQRRGEKSRSRLTTDEHGLAAVKQEENNKIRVFSFIEWEK